MSDLQALLGKRQTPDSSEQDEQQSQKRKPTPKPERVKAREKATGTDAVWDPSDNGGRGGWVIPGLSEKMGGPKGVKSGPFAKKGEEADPAISKVMDLVNSKKMDEATAEFQKLDPKKYQGNKQYEQLQQMLKGKVNA